MTKLDQYQQFIHTSRYARWIESEQRRETWSETVDRYIDFFKSRIQDEQLPFDDLRDAILNLKIMPSMRCLMTAGPALERDNIAGYNCSALSINRPQAFAEVLYILMNGTGVGFSCERQEIAKLPSIPDCVLPINKTIIIADSKAGWFKAFNELIHDLYGGCIPSFDFSHIRPAGARLKTFGGRASGPAPLRELFQFTTETFRAAQGRKLTSIEVHDIVCKIGEIVIVGGVRRSALISLSNLSDNRMRNAKSGEWWINNPQRALANNSAVYTERPDAELFIEEWLALAKSKSGERGIVNRAALQKQAAKHGLRRGDIDYLLNPCAEIILRDQQFCNLSTVIVRSGDSFEELMKKIELATILGTMQATLTDFKVIDKGWVENTREEALLGVSMTGVMDHPVLSGAEGEDRLTCYLQHLRDKARQTNNQWADRLGINRAGAVTCIKPEGTVSQLADAASGIHTRHSDYYIRTVRVDKKDPLYAFMKAKGFPLEDCVIKPDSIAIASFPIRSPEGAMTREDVSAIKQLNTWLIYQRVYCDHKPSVTVSVKSHEWMEVGAWVFDRFDELSGVSFLPHSEHTYQQAPYQQLTKEEWERWVKDHPIPECDWSDLSHFETEDHTTNTQELACSGGSCDIV